MAQSLTFGKNISIVILALHQTEQLLMIWNQNPNGSFLNLLLRNAAVLWYLRILAQ